MTLQPAAVRSPPSDGSMGRPPSPAAARSADRPGLSPGRAGPRGTSHLGPINPGMLRNEPPGAACVRTPLPLPNTRSRGPAASLVTSTGRGARRPSLRSAGPGASLKPVPHLYQGCDHKPLPGVVRHRGQSAWPPVWAWHLGGLRPALGADKPHPACSRPRLGWHSGAPSPWAPHCPNSCCHQPCHCQGALLAGVAPGQQRVRRLPQDRAPCRAGTEAAPGPPVTPPESEAVGRAPQAMGSTTGAATHARTEPPPVALGLAGRMAVRRVLRCVGSTRGRCRRVLTACL